MRQHFSIGVGSELVTAFALQLFAQRRIIFDHAVVHKRDFSALVKVRMGVFVGHFSMSSPARVADAVLPRGGFSVMSLARFAIRPAHLRVSICFPFTIATPAES